MINNTVEHILALPRPAKRSLVLGVDALLVRHDRVAGKLSGVDLQPLR